MSKKLTLFEVETILRQLDKTIIKPLEKQLNKKLAEIPDNQEFIVVEKRLADIEEEIDNLATQRDQIRKVYNIGYYYLNSPKEQFAKLQRDWKKSQLGDFPIPTQQELKDLIILNSNLDLQEIIEKITQIYQK